MDATQRTIPLDSIDHTLAAMRAALAAAEDADRTEEPRTELACGAGADMARLAFSNQTSEWGTPPPEVDDAIGRAGDPAVRGALARAEEEPTAAREALGGRSH